MMKNKGFTLIELLVVVAIIGLLSVIVLAGIQDARTKAQNTKLNEIAMQYINAFALLTNGGQDDYPTSNHYICLGYSDNASECATRNISKSIDDDLKKYYPDLPENSDFKVSALNISGILYINKDNQPRIEWYLSGDMSCVRNSTKTFPELDSNTLCKYSF